MACGKGVSPVEIACIVRQYLQEHSFVRSYEAFRYDAKALLVDVPVRFLPYSDEWGNLLLRNCVSSSLNSSCVKSLLDILNEYVELKEKEARRQQTANPLAEKMYELIDFYCANEAAAPVLTPYVDASSPQLQLMPPIPKPYQKQSRSRKKSLSPLSACTPPLNETARRAFNSKFQPCLH
eukprot:2917008-Pyramimonas_sp.AAC.2